MGMDVVGLLCCLASAGLFGCMFVPIKLVGDAGNGLFTQWITGMGIFSVGLVIYGWQAFARGLFLFPMLGGAFWAIGNAMAFPIMTRLGMGIGILIWNTTNCFTGWAFSRMGLLGLDAQSPASNVLNFGGLIMVITGGVIFSQVKGADAKSEAVDGVVKSPKKRKGKDEDGTEMAPLRDREEGQEAEAGESEEGIVKEEKKEEEGEKSEKKETKKEASSRAKAEGILMALVSGCLYALTFYPTNYVIKQAKAATAKATAVAGESSHPLGYWSLFQSIDFSEFYQDGLHYVPSVYAGIFLTTTIIFMVYAITTRNRPVVSGELALPAFFSGIIWGIAQMFFFLANDRLAQTVTFPVITSLPGVIAAVLSLLVFNETNKETRNLLLLGGGVVITITGACLIGLSITVNFF